MSQRTLNTTVTHLQMETRAGVRPPPPPLLRAAILRAENPPLHFYRYLYREVGHPYYWVERFTWNDEKLAAMLNDPKVSLYVLYVSGVPAGFAELDFRDGDDCRVAYFGLVPDFAGRRIGPWFLNQVIDLAWSEPIAVLKVNTCSLDHRKALSTYQRAGFAPYARSEKTIMVPEDF